MTANTFWTLHTKYSNSQIVTRTFFVVGLLIHTLQQIRGSEKLTQLTQLLSGQARVLIQFIWLQGHLPGSCGAHQRYFLPGWTISTQVLLLLSKRFWLRANLVLVTSSISGELIEGIGSFISRPTQFPTSKIQTGLMFLKPYKGILDVLWVFPFNLMSSSGFRGNYSRITSTWGFSCLSGENA